MKKMLYTLIALICPLAVQAQGTALTIATDKESKVDNCVVIVMEDDEEEPYFLDTLAINGNYLEVTLPIDRPREGLLYLRSNDPTVQALMPQYMIFVPGEKIEMKVPAKGEFSISGSPFYQQAGEVKDQLNVLDNEYTQKLAAYSEAIKQPNANQDSLKNEMGGVYQTYMAARLGTITEYAKTHPDNEGIALWLPYAGQKASETIGYLSNRVRTESCAAPFIQNILKKEAEAKVREEARRNAQKNIAEGKPAPDFTLKDINGKDLSLSSLRGKFVVLDFWGAWCGWCIKGMPKMKEYYAKYKGKFEILGIDCNDSPEKWKKAVADHQLPWLHVYNPKNGTVPSTYAITGFPTKIVVDPEGKIAKIVVGESEDFYTYLDEVLSK